MSGTVEGWRCPRCGSHELDVVVEAWAELEQTLDEPENMVQTCADQADHDWDGDSPMKCRECMFLGKAQDFKFESGPAGTLLTTEEDEEKPLRTAGKPGRMGRGRPQGASGRRKRRGQGRGRPRAA